MRRALVIFIAVIALAGVVIAIAPASLAGVILARASGGALALVNADGTIWRGHGTLAAADALRLPLAWSIDPWSLLRGELRLDVAPPTASGRTPSAAITARGNTVTVRDLDVMLPAAAVGALAPHSGIRIDGSVRVMTSSLAWTPAKFSGGARIEWQDARFVLGDDARIGLGSVTATLTAAADRLTGPVSNDGGEFAVRGTLAVAASGATNMTVTMTPRGGDPAGARTFLLSAKPGAPGWKLELQMGAQ